MRKPSAARFYELYERGQAAGLLPEVAYGYAALSWWGEHYGIAAPRITSGNRTYAQQKALWDARASNPYPVAPPGTSRHEGGKAFDLPSSARLDVYGYWAPLVGLTWGGSWQTPDRIHFEKR